MASIRRRRNRVEVKFNEAERSVLLSIVDDLSSVLGTVPRTTPHAFDDDELEAEYHRWVVPELVTTRNTDIDAIRSALSSDEEHSELSDEQAMAWIRGLNHLRLAAGGMLGVEGDDWESAMPPAERDRDEYRMLTALGWVQEAMVDALNS